MPVKEIKVDANRANYVSLDYDGIRLVYPNTTFGPGFGHRLEQKSEVEDAFVGIESMPYSLFQGITQEERLELMEYVGIVPDEFIDPNTIEHPLDINPTLDFTPTKHLKNKKIEANIPSVYNEIDMITKSNRLLEQQINSYKYIHDKLFANNEEARMRLKNAMNSLLKELETRNPQSLAEVILGQAHRINPEAYIIFKKLMKKINQGVSKFITMIGVYLHELRDHEILYYFEEVIEPYRADMANHALTNEAIYKDTCILMHCINILKVILIKLSRKYSYCVVLLDSQICAIITLLKNIYAINLNDLLIHHKKTKRVIYYIVLNLQMMFHYIKYRNEKDKMVTMYNYQDEINKLKVEIVNYQDLMKVANEEEKKNAESKILSLEERIDKLEKLIETIKRTSVSSRFKFFFWPQDRFSPKLAEIYMDLTASRQINNSILNTQVTLGKQLIDNTSSNLRFEKNSRVVGDIEKNYDDLLITYLNILYSNFDNFFYDAILLFGKEPDGKKKVLEKYKVFTLSREYSDKFPLKPLFQKKKDLMIRYFKKSASEYIGYTNNIHHGKFLMVATNEIEKTDWNTFIKDIEAWFSEEIVKELKAIYTKRFNITNMILYCLKPFQHISFYDDVTKKKLDTTKKEDMYLIRFSNIQTTTDIDNFMNGLFYYMRHYSDMERKENDVEKNPEYDLTEIEDNTIPALNIEDIINSIHLIDAYTAPSFFNRDEDELRIVIGLNNRHAVFQFMHLMFKHEFDFFAIKRTPEPLRTTTYLLYNSRYPNAKNSRSPPNKNPRVFFIRNEIPNPNSVQIDLLTDYWKREGRTQRLTARMHASNKIAYHVYMTLEGILKSCAIYSTNFYLVPRWDKQDKKLVYIKKYDQKNMRKTENVVHFYSNVIKSLMWYISQNNSSDEAMKTLNDLIGRIIRLVKDTQRDFIDMENYAKNPKQVNDAIVDECYLAMCYNYDRSRVTKMWKFIPDKMKDILNVIGDKQFEIMNIALYYPDVEMKEIEEEQLLIGNITQSSDTNEEYYKSCLESFTVKDDDKKHDVVHS